LEEGETYYLAISAFDTDSNESFLTGEIEITTSSIPMTPIGITSTSYESTIVIDWEPNQGELDLAGYNLYRWEIDDVPDTVLHAYIPTPASSFSDENAETHVLYGYYVTAVDSQVPPNESGPTEAVFGQLVTHDMGILVVDNTLDGTGGPFSPTDEDVDAFYSGILQNYNVGGLWDMSDSVATGRTLMDYDLGIYSVVLWHMDIRGIRPVSTDTTTMRKFLDRGGNLWISGWQVLAFLTGNSEPYYVLGENGFVSRYAGIDSALTTSSTDRDFVGAESLVGGFPSISIDSTKVFPIGALYSMEILLPPFSSANSLYTYISSDSASSEYHGLPVAVTSNQTDYGLVVTDFPLYFMDQGDVESLVDGVMERFEEPLGISDKEVVGLPRAFSLSQNYPNPFNPSTTIVYTVSEGQGHVPVNLQIYNLRGQLVKTIVDETQGPGRYAVRWDGVDHRGREVSSGVYLYKIQAGKFVSTKKAVLLK
jgi:hypothetical protein